MSGPLSGVRVLDLTINVLGPVATQILGDMGADVIKLEPPQGDAMRRSGPTRNPGMAAFFLNLNRNKRSVALDLRRPAALEAALRLAERADVFVHSLRPDSAQRLGIGYRTIAARNSRIVYAFAPGYRADGPHRNRPAFDDVIQGESGVAAMMDQSIGEPRYAPTILADKFCGHILASAIGMALFSREKTGCGQELHVPMLETMLSFNLIEHLAHATFDPPTGAPGYDRMYSPHRRPYPTKDGHICMMAVTDEQWRRLLTALGRPEVTEDPRFATMPQRTLHINDIYAIVADAALRFTTAELRAALDAADIPNGPVNRLEDLQRDPYLVATGYFQHYLHPTEGPAVRTSIPVQFSGTPGSVRRPAPTLGAHTREVLAEIGYDDAAIAAITDQTPTPTSDLTT